MKNCGIIISKNALEKAMEFLECKPGPKGFVFGIKKGGNRRRVQKNKLILKVAWFNGKKFVGKKLKIKKKFLKIFNETVSNSKEWEFADYIDSRDKKAFSFSFIHFDFIEMLVKYERDKLDGVFVGGTLSDFGEVDPSSNTEPVKGPTFTFKLRPCKFENKELISAVIGLPLFSIGLPCPPSWKTKKIAKLKIKKGRKKKEIDPFGFDLISSLEQFQKDIEAIQDVL